MEDGQSDPTDKTRPQVIAEAYQVFECSWNSELENAGRFSVEDIDDKKSPPLIQGRGDFLDMRPNGRERKEDSVRGVLARVRQASAAGGVDRAAALPAR